MEGTTRKALVTAITKITGEKAVYRKVPTCNYNIDEITVLKDGSVNYPDGSDIIERLKEAGFMAESEQTQSMVEIPNTLTDLEMDELERLVASKTALIFKAFGAEYLDIMVSDDKISFPWFTLTEGCEAEKTAAYPVFITALVDMFKRQKRITATDEM